MKETMKSLAYLDTLTALSYGLLYETPEPITDELTPDEFENTADIEKDSYDDNDKVREFSELDEIRSDTASACDKSILPFKNDLNVNSPLFATLAPNSTVIDNIFFIM